MTAPAVPPDAPEEPEPSDPEGVLHLHPGGNEHDHAMIVGSRAGLLTLRGAIDRALMDGLRVEPVFAADGEGYTIEVRMMAEDDMTGLLMPYYRHRDYDDE